MPSQISTPFSDILSGKNAFYNQPDYLASTVRDLKADKALPPIYTHNIESKIIRIVKAIFALIIFPIALYHLLHGLIGKIVLPASSPTLMGLSKNHANESRQNIHLSPEWKLKRITVEVDGYKIDGAIMGTEATLGNGRWVLASNGNGEFYEDKLSSYAFKTMLEAKKGNAIVFNYPAVGASSGLLPSRQAMTKAYKAMLTFLEDKEKGIGARQIIGYGHSIGGGVQGDALQTHPLPKVFKYIFIKSRTFSNLSSIAAHLVSIIPCVGLVVKMVGWNIDSIVSSKKLEVFEIILQTARVNKAEKLTDSSKIIHDKVIPAEVTLGKALLDDDSCPKDNKLFIGIPEYHNQPLQDFSFLTSHIENYFARAT